MCMWCELNHVWSGWQARWYRNHIETHMQMWCAFGVDRSIRNAWDHPWGYLEHAAELYISRLTIDRWWSIQWDGATAGRLQRLYQVLHANVMCIWCRQEHLQCMRSSLRISGACSRALHKEIECRQGMKHTMGWGDCWSFAETLPSVTCKCDVHLV